MTVDLSRWMIQSHLRTMPWSKQQSHELQRCSTLTIRSRPTAEKKGSHTARRTDGRAALWAARLCRFFLRRHPSHPRGPALSLRRVSAHRSSSLPHTLPHQSDHSSPLFCTHHYITNANEHCVCSSTSELLTTTFREYNQYPAGLYRKTHKLNLTSSSCNFPRSDAVFKSNAS